MPFLLHKDVLSEETAASDYQRWLDDDASAEQDSCEPRTSRNDPAEARQPDDRRFEVYG